MKSAIGQIYCGENGFGKKIKETDKFWQLEDEISELVCDLQENLNKEQKELLSELENKFRERERETAQTHFKEGFKTGILIGLETAE